MKRNIFLALILAVALLFGGCNPAAPPDEPTSTAPIVNEETQNEEVVAFLYEIMETSFPVENVIIHAADGVAYVDVYQIGIANELSNLIIAGDSFEEWEELVSMAASSSADLHNLLLAQEQDYDLTFSICDNVNNEATGFIICTNGEVVFDMLTAVLESND